MAMSADKSETDQLTYGSETRDNFELENDPKHYVKDKYHYSNRRIKMAVYLFGGLLLMAAIIFLAVYLISGHRQKQNHWTVRRGPPPTIDNNNSNSSLLLANNETSSFSSFPSNAIDTTDPTAELQQTTATPLKISPQEDRRLFIRDMALEAWDAYSRYAWGHDALRPVSARYSGKLYGLNSGLTIVTSMSTLWVMNATKQFERGERWIEENLNLSAMEESVSVANTVQRYIGSLLACYLLSDVSFLLNPAHNVTDLLDRANNVADLLDPAYSQSPSGLPYEKLKLRTRQPSGPTPTLADLGGQHLEYVFLANQSFVSFTAARKAKLEKYQKRATTIRNFFAEQIKKPENGLYLKLVYIDGQKGEWRTNVSTLGQAGGNFYSYLLKAYIWSDGRDRQALTMFTDAMDALDRVGVFGLFHGLSGPMVFARDFHLNDHSLDDYMTSDACYLGGLMALAAHTLEKARKESSLSSFSDKTGKEEAKRWANRIARYWYLAEELTSTCYEAARQSPSGLPPQRFYFDAATGVGATNYKPGALHRGYHLSAELAESYFILWRLTRRQKYREWAWELATAIYRHCRVGNGGGFSGVDDVYNLASGSLPKTDYQNADLIAATLKYLYLTFDDGDNLPLDEWVFNAFGQPLPILLKAKDK